MKPDPLRITLVRCLRACASLLVVAALFSGCKGMLPPLVVYVSQPSVMEGQTLQFSAVLTSGLSSSIVWSVSSGPGTISANGLYTAPTGLSSQGKATITATAAANHTISGTQDITILLTPGITISEPTTTLPAGQTLQFSASIAGTSGNPVWSIASGPGTIDANGLYTAPAVSAVTANTPVTVAATLSSNQSVSATQTITVIPSASIAIAAPSTSVNLGQTLQFAANVTGSTGAATWSVAAGPGTITADGLYTAPDQMPANRVVTIAATLSTDANIVASQSITLADPATIGISPHTSTVDTNQSIQFTANIAQSSGTAVWSLSGPGTLTPGGLYTAPPTLPANPNATITATLSNDGAISTSIPITLVAIPAVSITAPSNTAALNNTIQFTATVMGTTDSVNWSVSSGGGTVSSTGLYKAPSSIPSNPNVTITATLANNSSVSANSNVTVIAAPTIVSSSPAALPTGQNNLVTLTGTGFTPGMIVLYNGEPAVTSYQSATTATVLLSADPSFINGTYPVTLVVQNPGSAGTSAPFSLPVAAASSTSVTIGSTPVLDIPAGFIGLSHEVGDGQWTMGETARGVNYAYRQLVRNLMDTPNSPFLIRMGGGSTDTTTTPVSMEEFNELHAALPGVTVSAGVILGNSLTSVPTTAENLAANYMASLNPGVLDSIEIGNETDNYHYSGSSSYSFDVYMGKYDDWTAGILNAVSPATPKFTGPSWALLRTLLNNNYWSNFTAEPPGYLQLFVAAEKGTNKTITQHFYSGLTGGLPPTYLLGYPLPAANNIVPPTALQYQNPGATPYYWVPSLLGWAANLAHQNGMTYRINEMNSVDGGGQPGTSDSFAAALWAVDTMFEFASAGVDGVNFHGANGGVRVTTPGQTCKVQGVTYQAPCTPTPIYAPWTFNIQHSASGYPLVYTLESVNPVYYGMYFFHLAVPDGSKLLPVTVQTPTYLKVWATQDASGTIRVALINKDISFSGDVAISLPGHGTAQSLLMSCANGYAGTVTYPDNTSLTGTTGITIGGQTWDGSTDGTLQGTQTLGTVNPVNGTYTVTVQPGTAVLLTIQP